MQPSLRTERLLLRPLRDDDADAFAAMNADPEVMRHYPQVLNRHRSDDLLARLRRDADDRGYGMWAMELPGSAPFIGMLGLAYADFASPFTPCVEIGWRVVTQHWNRGYATEGARATLRHGFEALGLEEVFGWTIPANLPSRRVMEKLGMRRDPALDFDHPRLPVGHHLRPHLLYRITPRAFGATAPFRPDL